MINFAEIPLIGRAVELDAIERSHRSAASERGGISAITGEAGSGKTRLAKAAAESARRLGFRSVIGRSRRDEAPALWPWIEVIEDLNSEDIVGGPQILPLPFTGTSETARQKYYAWWEAWQFLRRHSAEQPLLIVLEDLHWADSASLDLLEYLAPSISSSRLHIITTWRLRDGDRNERLNITAARIAQDPGINEYALAALGAGQTAELCAATAGRDVSQSLVDQLFRRAEGNPLFTIEFLRDSLERDYTLSASGHVPDSVQALIGDRLGRFSSKTQQMLAVAAIAGESFDSQLVRLISELDVEEFEQALTEATHAGILVREERGNSGYRFTHALVRDAIELSTNAKTRVALHKAMADAIAESPPNEDQHAALAFHYYESRSLCESAEVVRHCLAVGDRAYESFAFPEAINWYERALEAHRGEQRDHELASILAKLGAAEVEAGVDNSGGDHSVQALTILMDLEMFEDAVALALGPQNGILAGKSINLLERLSETLQPESEDRSLLESLIGVGYATQFNFDPAKMEDWLGQAIGRAKEFGHARALQWSLGRLCWGYASAQEFDRAIEVGEEALDRSDLSNDGEMAVHSAIWLKQSYLASGRVVDAVRVGEVAAMAANNSNIVRQVEHVSNLECQHRALSGDFAGVLHYADQWDRVSKFSGFGGPVLWSWIAATAVGDDQSAAEALNEFDFRSGWSRQGQHYSARVALCGAYLFNDWTMFTHREWRWDHQGIPRNRRDIWSWYARTVDALRVVAEHHPEQAEELYMLISRDAGRPAISMWGVFLLTDRLCGKLAELAGDRSMARHHFETAITIAVKCGLKSEEANAHLDLATLLSGHINGNDPALARQHLTRGRTVAKSVGFLKVTARADEIRGHLNGLRSRRQGLPADLTLREAEVLQLVSLGMTNHAIADQLFLTENTVKTHVRNVLRKTGTDNRAAATRWAKEHEPHLEV